MPGAVVAGQSPGENSCFGGVPAKPLGMDGYTPQTLEEKWEKLRKICSEFCFKTNCPMEADEGLVRIRDRQSEDFLMFYKNKGDHPGFYLDTKTYTKRLTPLEIEFMRFCQGGKVRFFPE